MIKASIACNLDANILRAALPLFSAGEVDAMEWSFDALYNHPNIPPWFVELVSTFSEGQGLIGHGIFFSLFSGKWNQEQDRWLKHLKKMANNFKFQHITEHFGFMTGANFHTGAPISVPLNKTTIAIGQDRLKRIFDACGCPVGLENLAFTYALEEVKKHGEFLDVLLKPINGFIILDLHNVYCQIHNFQIPFEEIIEYYNLDRVREIHISGGSWEPSKLAPEGKVRRDTHDDAVPEEVFELLQKTIPLCTNLKFVVMEQLGPALDTEHSQNQFRSDYRRMKKMVDGLANTTNAVNNFLPITQPTFDKPIESQELYNQQLELSRIIEQELSLENLIKELNQSNLKNTDWKVEEWSPHMLETVSAIARKWKSN